MFKMIASAMLSVCLFSLSGCGGPSGPRFQNVGSFNEGVAPVQTATGKWGYINQNNMFVIPARFEDAKEFKNNRAAVKLNGKWGFINKSGEWQ